MDILIFDQEIHDNDIFDILENNIEKINIEKTPNTNTFINHFNENKYNLVIIDVTKDDGETLFKEVTNIDEKQNVLVLSKTLSYNSSMTCDQCSQKYNRKLLLKPLKVNELANYIQNFDNLKCKYSVDSNEILEILDDVMFQFIYYHFDKKEKKILRTSNHENIRELILIVDLLNIHNINYIVQDDVINIYD